MGENATQTVGLDILLLVRGHGWTPATQCWYLGNLSSMFFATLSADIPKQTDSVFLVMMLWTWCVGFLIERTYFELARLKKFSWVHQLVTKKDERIQNLFECNLHLYWWNLYFQWMLSKKYHFYKKIPFSGRVWKDFSSETWGWSKHNCFFLVHSNTATYNQCLLVGFVCCQCVPLNICMVCTLFSSYTVHKMNACNSLGAHVGQRYFVLRSIIGTLAGFFR